MQLPTCSMIRAIPDPWSWPPSPVCMKQPTASCRFQQGGGRPRMHVLADTKGSRLWTGAHDIIVLPESDRLPSQRGEEAICVTVQDDAPRNTAGRHARAVPRARSLKRPARQPSCLLPESGPQKGSIVLLCKVDECVLLSHMMFPAQDAPTTALDRALRCAIAAALSTPPLCPIVFFNENSHATAQLPSKGHINCREPLTRDCGLCNPLEALN
eukprot:2612315-Pleurochrysis_carterae.AAC.2